MDIRTIEKHYTKHRRNRAILISLAVHGILVFGTALWLLKPLIEVEKDTIAVDFVVPPERIHIPKKVVSPVEKSQTAAAAQSQAAKLLSGTMSPIPRVDNTTRLEPPSLSTDADLIPSPESILGKSPTIRRGSGATEDGRGTGRSEIGTGLGSRGTGKGGGGLGNLTQGSGTGQDAFGGEGVSDIVGAYKDEIGGELDSILEEDGGVVRGHIRLIRLKHDMSDWWQDPTAIPSLIKWLQEHVKTISADMDYEGGALPLTDKRIIRDSASRNGLLFANIFLNTTVYSFSTTVVTAVTKNRSRGS